MLSTTQAIRLVAVKSQQVMQYIHTKCLIIMQLHSLLFAPSQAVYIDNFEVIKLFSQAGLAWVD